MSKPETAKPDWTKGPLRTLGTLCGVVENNLKADPDKWLARKDGLVAGLNLALVALEHFEADPTVIEVFRNLKDSAFNHAGLASLSRPLPL